MGLAFIGILTFAHLNFIGVTFKDILAFTDRKFTGTFLKVVGTFLKVTRGRPLITWLWRPLIT